jgi:hypothetical protein
MTDDDLLIGELYVTIIEGAFTYLIGGGLLANKSPGSGGTGQRR